MRKILDVTVSNKAAADSPIVLIKDESSYLGCTTSHLMVDHKTTRPQQAHINFKSKEY